METTSLQGMDQQQRETERSHAEASVFRRYTACLLLLLKWLAFRPSLRRGCKMNASLIYMGLLNLWQY